MNEAQFPGVAAASVAGGVTPPPLPPPMQMPPPPSPRDTVRAPVPGSTNATGFAPPPPPSSGGGISPGARRAILVVGGLVLISLVASALLIGRAIGSVSTVSNLETGDCIEDFITSEEVFLVTTTDCSNAHALEVFESRADFWSTDDQPHPGMNSLFLEGEAFCADKFEQFVGEPFESSPLGMWTFVPIVEGWAQGDRSVQCIVGAWDEVTLTTGSLRNSAGREAA